MTGKFKLLACNLPIAQHVIYRIASHEKICNKIFYLFKANLSFAFNINRSYEQVESERELDAKTLLHANSRNRGIWEKSFLQDMDAGAILCSEDEINFPAR